MFTMMALWLFTCGIYAWWWLFKVCGEINTFLGYDRVSPFKVILLIPVTCGLYSFYFYFVEGKNVIREVQQKAGVPEKVPFLVGPIQLQRALNEVWEAIP